MQWPLKSLNGNNMKLIRFAFISVVVIGGLITAISSLFPSTVITSRAVEVNATQAQIQHCVQDLAKLIRMDAKDAHTRAKSILPWFLVVLLSNRRI